MKAQKFKDLASLGITQIFGTAITAIFWFFISNVMDPDQYGRIIFYTGVAGFVSYFALVGTQQTITIYIAKKIPVQSVFFSISLAIGVIGSLVVIILHDRIDVSFLVLAYVINTLAMGEMLGNKDYSRFSIYVLVQKIATLVLGLSFFYAFGPDGIIYALALSYAIFLTRIAKGFRESKINFSVIRGRWGFVINNYVLNLTAGLNGQIDKIIIPPILGFAILGNYGLALQALNVLSIAPNIFFKYLLPQDASGNTNKKIKSLSFIISICVALFGTILLPMIINTFFPKYDEAVVAIQIMSISVIPIAVNLQYTSEFLAKEQSRVVLISYLLSITSLAVGMVMLGPPLGIIGLAIAQLFSIGIGAVFFVFVKLCDTKHAETK